MLCLILPVLALAAAHPVIAQTGDTTGLMAAYRDKTQALRPCDRSGDAIVVCGNQAERNARERLPLPRDPIDGGVPMRGDPPRASAAPVRQGSCGAVGGQAAGCVGGLPLFRAVDMLGKIVTAIVDPDPDPDADPAPPPPLPSDRFGRTGRR